MLVDELRDAAIASISGLLKDVDEAVFVDFPDYANVGDSAIALGMLAALDHQGVHVSAIGAIATFPEAAVRSARAVVINGGGNLGGLYPVIDEHRIKVAKSMPSGSPLIQGPQTVRFVDDALRLRLERHVLARPNLRIGVRDRTSLESVSAVARDAVLAPDAAHVLGRIAAPVAKERILVLQRTDDESAANPVHGARDWIRDDLSQAAISKFRWQSRHLGSRVQAVVNPSPSQWESTAQRRLRRGAHLLARGEIVVTDRLHAMILALAMGRRVIAVDNSNAKLTQYAEQWLQGEAVEFAPDFERAMKAATRLTW